MTEASVYDDKLALYEYYMRILENINSPKSSVELILNTINSSKFIEVHHLAEMPMFIEAIKFHTAAYWAATEIYTITQLESYIQVHHIAEADNPLMCTPYNLAQCISRAAVHLVWRQCYLLSLQLRKNPKQSMINPLEASQKAYRDILKRLAPQLLKELEK